MTQLLDDFVDLSGWQAIASGLAELRISPDEGPHGKAMRLDFDFKGGGGFVVARKRVSMTLPESYAFSFGLARTEDQEPSNSVCMGPLGRRACGRSCRDRVRDCRRSRRPGYGMV